MAGRAILLIEDNPSDIELARRALGRNRLVVAEDGEEALDYLWARGRHAQRDISDLPALTLLDLKLPGVSGLEILRSIRSHEKTRRIPVVILSSSSEESDVAAAYDLGANSYLRKPVDFQKFQRSAEQLVTYWLRLNEPPPVVG
jgi:two-component system response regulator